MSKTKKSSLSDNEIRNVMLQFFHSRHKNATSARGKAGYAVRMSDVKKGLKDSHNLSQQQVVSNLSYLIDQGWIAEEQISKSVPLKSGVLIPQVTSFYKITAAGVDKIDGPGEFSVDKFRGIKIEATGQNIITLGDGNQVNSSHSDIANALIDLRKSIIDTRELSESDKLDVASDIDSIESQLVKSAPSKPIIRAAWENIARVSSVVTLAEKVGKAAQLLAPFLS